MAVKSASRDQPISLLLDQDKRLESIYQHLERGEYEHVISDFQKLSKIKSREDSPYLESLIKSANQLCLACIQFRKEVGWYEKAQAEAELREGELLQQLITILRLLQGALEPESRTGEQKTKKTSQETASLWERLQKLLGFKTHLEKPDQTVFGSFEIEASGNKSSFVIPQFPGEQLPLDLLSNMDRVIEFEKEKVIIPSMNGRQSKKPKASNRILEGESIPEPPSLVVYCLGPFQVYQDEHQVTEWLSNKGKMIFKYLITHREHPVHKDILMDLCWPNTNPESARNNLNVAIYGLRQALHKSRPSYSRVLYLNEEYTLDPNLRIWADVEEFEQNLTDAQYLTSNGNHTEAFKRLETAITLYKGDLLEGDIYEEWTVMIRERLRLAYLNALHQLSRHFFQQKKYAACAALCQEILARDNCREDVHCILMRCFAHQGQIPMGLRQYQICVEALLEELGVSPSESTVRLYEQLKRREITKSHSIS